MKVTWRKKQYPAPILEGFEPSRFTRKADGRPSYRLRYFGELHDAASTLLSFLDISGSSAGTEEKVSAIVSAIMEAGACNRLNSGFFISELSRRLRKLELRPEKEFSIIGHVSVASALVPDVVRRRIGDAEISIGTNTTHFKEELQGQSVLRDRLLQHCPASYAALRVDVTARSPDEALSRTGRALGLLLAWWNHALTYGRTKICFSGRPGPVAEVVLAPLRTLHTRTGSFLSVWCYDADFAEYPDPLAVREQWDHLGTSERQVRRWLIRHRHREFLEDAFLAYYTACTSHLLDWAFLSLWTLLETLTGSDQGETVIRRALFPLSRKSYDHSSWELRHLNHHRNSYVHRGRTRSDIQRLVYQLKLYVDFMLKWWLLGSRAIEDREEVFELLDTPRDPKRLSARICLLKRALKHSRLAGQ